MSKDWGRQRITYRPSNITRLTFERDVVITSIGDIELLLGYIDTLVQVQVGPVPSSNGTEVETEVLGRVGV